jgi:hypothetical protein
MQLVKNVLGREVPTEINGKTAVPFKGIGKHKPTGRKTGPPIPRGADFKNKVLKNIDEALDRLNLKNGMTISFHHHLRNGDYIINMIVDKLAGRGLKDMVLAPSALFPVHEPLVDHIKNGTVSHVLGSMNGPVGRLCSVGGMEKDSHSALAWRQIPRYPGRRSAYRRGVYFRPDRRCSWKRQWRSRPFRLRTFGICIRRFALRR